MEIGLFSFVENTKNPQTGEGRTAQQRVQDLMEEIKLADELGFDVYAIGEHHREEFVASNPATLLAAAATITKNIRLSSSVTVLGSEDPVRVFQEFATLDLISNGRAEIIVGRGSFIESFPLFGYDLTNYEELFEEKLELLLKLREENPITWQGKYRPAIKNLGIFPQPVQDKMPIWRAVGGTPKSAYVTGALGLPLALAIIGGVPEQFVQFAEIHRQAAAQHGHQRPKLSINSHGFILEDSSDAVNQAFPVFKHMMDKIGAERGWPPMRREQFEASATLRGANFVGSPQQVIDKILHQHELFGHDRFLMKTSIGSFTHAQVMKSIELFGTKVMPVVKKEIESRKVKA
ncbi:MAG: LLM class flavin-dependent oxidoreductase [Balneolaceae bacterium]|nr:LLM class flavin-dependent oxidoreductase [Balneolaceae bacterium]